MRRSLRSKEGTHETRHHDRLRTPFPHFRFPCAQRASRTTSVLGSCPSIPRAECFSINWIAMKAPCSPRKMATASPRQESSVTAPSERLAARTAQGCDCIARATRLSLYSGLAAKAQIVKFIFAIVFVFLAASIANAQAPVSPPPPSADPTPRACGPSTENFVVTIDKVPSPTEADPQPTPGKALAYLVQDDAYFDKSKKYRPIVKWGVDGGWVGATRHRAYLAIQLDPGEHRVCAEWQVPHTISVRATNGTIKFTAVAGRT
jgi:hypothetical protein